MGDYEKNLVRINRSVYNLLLSQIFDDVRFKFSKKVLRKKIDVPWMRYREIDFITNLIKNIKPDSCLEWGAGLSTTFFTKYIPEHSKWLSVEHDEEWSKAVDSKINAPNISIVLKTANYEPEDGIYTSGTYTQDNDGTYRDFKNYIEFPEEQSPFDFILIDGRAREQCLIKAKDYLSEEGIVLLHDANRTYYHNAFKHYKFGEAFLDHRNDAGGIWIGKNGQRPLSDYIDVDTYSKLWKLYSAVGRFIKV